MTPLAIQLRAKLRKDKRMRMGLTCGVCGNLLENVSAYLLENIRKGHSSMGKCTQCKQKDHETKKKCNRCQVFLTQQHFTPHNWQHQATQERICSKCTDEEQQRISRTLTQKYYCDTCKEPIDMSDKTREQKHTYRFVHGQRHKKLECRTCMNLGQARKENHKKE